MGEQQSAALWNPARGPAVAPRGEQRALHRVSLAAVRLADIENVNSEAASFFSAQRVRVFQGAFSVVHLCVRIIRPAINYQEDFLSPFQPPQTDCPHPSAGSPWSIAPTSPASFRLRPSFCLCFRLALASTFITPLHFLFEHARARALAVSLWFLRARIATMTVRRRTRTCDMAASGRRHVEALVSHQNPAQGGKSSPRASVCLAVCLSAADLG